MHGAKVYMGARSESRAKEAISSILSENHAIGQEHIIWLPLDLSKLFNIVEATQLLSSWEERLDILSAFALHSVYHSLTLIMSYLHSQ